MDDSFLTLHGLLVKKAGTAEEVSAVVGLNDAVVTAALDEAVAAGSALGAGGKYMLSQAGRDLLVAGYAEQCAHLRADDRFVSAYERFEVVNRKLLDVFTRWQTVSSGVDNDHSDAAYDHGIIDELGDIDDRADGILAGFASAAGRYGLYRARLSAAYDRVLAGQHDYVSGARVDSYHTVWFELHEDLLRVLGRERDA